MANTATKTATINMRGKTIHQYHVVIDTTGEDLTIHTPTGNNNVFVMGCLFSETNATNVTFKTGSTTLFVPELAANQAPWTGVDRGMYYFATNAGEALKIQASVAISSICISVCEAESFN